MASELDQPKQTEPIEKKSGESRRSFLAKLGLGAAALALVAGPLSAVRGIGSGNNSATAQDFPRRGLHLPPRR